MPYAIDKQGTLDLVGGLVNALRQLSDAAGRRVQEHTLAIDGVPAG